MESYDTTDAFLPLRVFLLFMFVVCGCCLHLRLQLRCLLVGQGTAIEGDGWCVVGLCAWTGCSCARQPCAALRSWHMWKALG